ncbi:VOC family protein [Knoellia sp. Soil729]|uniref:VOC family protein n=1 Tax=Knoellia sp. Soil729 TaxID=1736394 RepID=UPI0006F6C177|nr:VOC family protein [Knoellia sp. Soil729]KRE43470.1 glyoxalase [Knoellia sp. Soil729]
MISDHTPVTTLGVSDLQRARDFYEGTLGFAPGTEMMDQGITYRSGSGSFFVYLSEFAGSNKATAMMFELPDDAFDGTVDRLRSKGVTFTTFEAEGMEFTDGVASMGDGAFRSVWFEDPDGNILNLGTPMP